MDVVTPVCTICSEHQVHALAVAIESDNIDLAMALGLLDFSTPVDACKACTSKIEMIVLARDARLRALAARERYRQRERRLSERARIRAEKRAAAQRSNMQSTDAQSTTTIEAPSLPPAAAAALARAKAKALAKRGNDA